MAPPACEPRSESLKNLQRPVGGSAIGDENFEWQLLREYRIERFREVANLIQRWNGNGDERRQTKNCRNTMSAALLACLDWKGVRIQSPNKTAHRAVMRPVGSVSLVQPLSSLEIQGESRQVE